MRLIIAALLLGMNAVSYAGETDHGNPRAVIEAYVAAALAGKSDAAASLAVEGREASSESTLRNFGTLFDVKQIKIPVVWVDESNGQAIAKTEKVKITKANPDGRNTGHLVFTLTMKQGKWLVDDIDFDTKDEAMQKVETFKKENPDAKSLPVESND